MPHRRFKPYHCFGNPQKPGQFIALGQRIPPPQIDQLAAIPRLEQQVTQHPCPAGFGRPRPAQEQAQRRRQFLAMARGDFVDRLARRNHQHLYRCHAKRGSVCRRAEMAELIQTLQQFDIAFQAVNERAVEHVPADLRQGRFLAGPGALQRLLADHCRAGCH